MKATDVPPEVLSFALGYLVLAGLGLVWAGQKVFLWMKKKFDGRNSKSF